MRIDFTEAQNLLEILEEARIDVESNDYLKAMAKLDWALNLVKEWCE